MKLFLLYIRGHLRTLLLSLCMIAVFAVVTLLYDYPAEPVLYAACICLYLGILVCLAGFFRFRRRHMILQKLMDSIAVSTQALPAPRTVLEADYAALIHRLAEENGRLDAEMSAVRREYEDYYTMWAHQIKTPIAAMRLLLQSGGSRNPELAAELFRIEEYVGMALGYVRSESMTSDLLLRRISLDAVIRQAVRKYASVFIAQKISLHYENVDVQVVTDEKWLLFVLEQLLSNALKYTKQGSISIFMLPDTPKTLVIADTGIGIRAEDIPRVFERGYTGYNGREYNQSTGIGLYLCRRIMQKLGHRISIESEAGRGTRVLLDLQEYNYSVNT